MGFESWRAFYLSDLQAVWSLLPLPAACLLFLLVSRRARAAAARSSEARFLRLWALLFSFETLLDPLVGGKLAPWLGLSGGALTAVILAFVLLGDFRVYWLVLAFALGDVRRSAWIAALVTPAVPVLAFAGERLARAFAPDASGVRLWLIHELLFTGVALGLRSLWLPRRAAAAPELAFLRGVCAYVALYYGLWAVCDALWLLLDLDAAWGLRALPNQLYYACFVPFVWLTYSRRG